MNKFRRMSLLANFLVCALLLLSSYGGHAQGVEPPEPYSKLDPVLQILVKHPISKYTLPPSNSLEESELATDAPLPLSVLVPLSQSIGGHLGGSNPTIDVLITYTGDPLALEKVGAKVYGQLGNIVTANVPLGRLEELVQLPEVVTVEAAKRVYTTNDVSVAETGAPVVHSDYGATGRDILVGIVDTGIDIKHGDFRKADGTTRIKYLLDLSDPGDKNGDGLLDGSNQAFGGILYTSTFR